MKEAITQNRSHNLGVRVCAHQKAEYQQIAKFHDLSTSEWAGNVSVVAAILSILEEEIIYFNKQQSWKEKVQE